MFTYDLMESARTTRMSGWKPRRAFASYPAFAMSMNPVLPLLAAWGEVTERTFSSMTAKPDKFSSIVGPDGCKEDHLKWT